MHNHDDDEYVVEFRVPTDVVGHLSLIQVLNDLGHGSVEIKRVEEARSITREKRNNYRSYIRRLLPDLNGRISTGEEVVEQDVVDEFIDSHLHEFELIHSWVPHPSNTKKYAVKKSEIGAIFARLLFVNGCSPDRLDVLSEALRDKRQGQWGWWLEDKARSLRPNGDSKDSVRMVMFLYRELAREWGDYLFD